MGGFAGDGFRVDWEWKEVVRYSEGDHVVEFDAGWGVVPPLLHVPSAATWEAEMSEWLHGRRDVVVRRLQEHSGHDVRES